MRIQFFAGAREGEEHDIEDGAEVVLGRGSEVTIPLDDPKLSRRHCSILFRSGRWRVQDHGSANGTWLNGEQVESRAIVDGDTLKIGDTVIDIDGTGFSARPSPAAGTAASPPLRAPSPNVAVPVLAVVAVLLVAGLGWYFFHDPLQDAGDPGPKNGVVSKSSQPAKRKKAIPLKKKSVDWSQLGEGVGGDEDGAPSTEWKKELAKFLEAKEFRKAEEHLRLIEGQDARDERKRVQAIAREHLAKVGGEAEAIAKSGDLPGSRKLLQSWIARLPENVSPDVLDYLGRIERSERSRREREGDELRSLGDVAREARIRIGALDFDAARKAVVGLSPGAGGSVDDAREFLVRQVDASTAAWGVIAERLSDTKLLPPGLTWERTRFVTRIADDEIRVVPARPTGVARIVGRRGGQLKLKVGEREIYRDVFCLGDRTLWSDVLLASNPDQAARRQLFEGFVTLLLYREGEERTNKFLSSSVAKAELFVEEVVSDYRAAIREGGVIVFDAMLEELSAERPLLLDDPAKAFDGAQRAADLLKRSRGVAAFATRRARVKSIYRDLRAASLQESAVPDLGVRATSIRRDGAEIVLTYKFDSKEEARDFRSLGGGGVSVSKGYLKLSGEAQFLGKALFRNTLQVRLALPSSGYTKSAPNIVVALWTNPEESVRPRGTLSATRAVGDGRPGPAEYLVFGAWYKAPVSDYAGSPREEVRVIGATEFTKLPAHVLFRGWHGVPLHKEPGETLLARALKKSTSGKKTMLVRAGNEEVEWRIGKRSVIPSDFEHLKYASRVGVQPGTFNLYARTPLAFSAMEIRGEIDPVKLSDEVESTLDRELKQLER
ncbi:MAG: FHA domain-containing protein [Planctomycetota bacterium]